MVTAAKPRACRCIAKADRALATKHTRVVTTFALAGRDARPAMVVLATELVADAPRRTRPVSLVASFCPLCGKEYPK